MKYLTTILLSAAVASCGTKTKPQMPELSLKVATATERVVPNNFEFISQTKATRSYIIQSRVNGYLKSINFRSGMPVKRGQLLFTIDNAPFRTQVAEARAALSSAKSALVQAQAEYDRSLPLSKINAISQSQLDAAVATLAAAKEQVSSCGAVVENAMLNMSYCTITAPGSGIIAPSSPNVGDYVGAGTSYQTLTTISFDDSVSVNLSLPTREYYKIASQKEPSYMGNDLLSDITLTLSDGTVYPHKGVYQYTRPEVDNQSGSIVFNVRFPNPDGLLKGGQFARVNAEVGKAVPQVMIPSRAVNEIQGVYNTYVVGKDDVLEFRKITVGDVVGSEWIVLDGIAPGDRVITEGFSKAKNGMKIKSLF